MNHFKTFVIRYYFLLFFIGCISSCADKEVDIGQYEEIQIDNTKIEKIKDISEIVESITCIPLKDSGENMLGSIFKVHVVGDKYVVFDRFINNRISLFDSEGKFEKTIMSSGAGPNAALNITDSWPTNDKGYEVYDYAQMKIFRFDSAFELVNGVKAREFYHFVSMRKISGTNSYIGYAGFDEKNGSTNGKLFHIALLDKDLNVTNTSDYFDKAFDGIIWLVFNEHFSMYKDTLRFVRPYDNFVYDVTNEGINKRFKIVYKEDPLPEDVMTIVFENIKKFKDRTMNPNERSAALRKYARFGGHWLENDKYIYISSRDSEGEYGNYFFTLLNKEGKKVIVNANSFCETQRYKLVLPPFVSFDSERNEFIGVMTGAELKNAMYEDSNFYRNEIDDPESFFLIKVKIK